MTPDETQDKNGACRNTDSVNLHTPNDTHTKSRFGEMCGEQMTPHAKSLLGEMHDPR